MEAKVNAVSMNMAVLNQTPFNNVKLFSGSILSEREITNFRDASGRCIRTKNCLIFKVKD